MVRRKIAGAVLAAGLLAGAVVGGAATSASAATHWSGNYATKKACELARISHHDYGQPTSACYSSYDRNGRLSYYFYWYS